MGKAQKLKELRRIEREQQELAQKDNKRTFKLIGLVVVMAIVIIIGWKFLGSSPAIDNMPEESTTEEKIAVIETNLGVIKFKMFTAEAPKTVENFEKLATEGFYDGIKFHRVIKDFMIQTGDPNSKDDDWSNDGQGGPGYSFEDEINEHLLVQGSLAMANSGPNTNGSQFFIVTATSTPWLDGKHTNFGQVIEGIEVVKQIEAAAANENDHPLEDIVMEKVYIEE